MILVLLVAVLASSHALRCYECGQSGGCDTWNTTVCTDTHAFCFRGVEGSGCLANCTTNSNVSQCCESDLCNNATSPTTTAVPSSNSTIATTTAVPSRNGTIAVATTMSSPSATPTTGPPLMCYHCSQLTKEDCDTHRVEKTCAAGDVCRLVVSKLAAIFGGGVTSFQRDCNPRQQCQDSNDCTGTFGGNCIRCCDCDLCNDGDIDARLSCSLAPFQCYDCSQVNKEDCDIHQVEKTCAVGDVCRLVVNKLSPHFGGRVQSFERDCFPRQLCQDSNACNGDSGGNCIRCCNSHFCNGEDFGFGPTASPPPGNGTCDSDFCGHDCQTPVIDECAGNGGSGPCDHICTDTCESHDCSCRSGYILQEDGRSCEDINECNTTAFPIRLNNCEQECINTPGSFSCKCKLGYTLGDDGGSCNVTPCDGDHFMCGGGSCIIKAWRCDGLIHCDDGSDEEDCDVADDWQAEMSRYIDHFEQWKDGCP